MIKLTMCAVSAAVLGLTTLQATANEGLDRTFGMVNESNQTIVAVHAKHIDRRTFDYRDLLGDYVVAPGQWIQLDPIRHQGYCRFDLQIAFDNGDLQNISDVNLCEATTVVTYGYDSSHNAFYHGVLYG